jgi:hypothetical protein
MREKRKAARGCAAPAQGAVAGAEVRGGADAIRTRVSASVARQPGQARSADDELIVPQRPLGFSADESRRAAAACRDLEDAPLEPRIRRALANLQPRPSSRDRGATPSFPPRVGAY